MRQMGLQSSALGVAKLYRDFCGTLMIDAADARQKKAIEAMGMNVVVASTVMSRGLGAGNFRRRDVSQRFYGSTPLTCNRNRRTSEPKK